jgi:hypothetical protein
MVKKLLKIVLIALVFGFVMIQFFRIDKTNPTVNAAETIEASVNVPPDIKLILGRSCNDCHTNQTIYPWYTNIQPSGWFMKDHIDDGRRELNFSVWSTYTAKRKSKKLEEICEQVESGAMPIPSYLWIHRDAVLRDGDAQALCDWAKGERAKIETEVSNAK